MLYDKHSLVLNCYAYCLNSKLVCKTMSDLRVVTFTCPSCEQSVRERERVRKRGRERGGGERESERERSSSLIAD